MRWYDVQLLPRRCKELFVLFKILVKSAQFYLYLTRPGTWSSLVLGLLHGTECGKCLAVCTSPSVARACARMSEKVSRLQARTQKVFKALGMKLVGKEINVDGI